MLMLTSENEKVYILNLRVRFRFQKHDLGVFILGKLCKAQLLKE